MHAFKARILPATHTKPVRIKVDDGETARTYPRSKYEGDLNAAVWAAVEEYARQWKWPQGLVLNGGYHWGNAFDWVFVAEAPPGGQKIVIPPSE